MNRQTLVLVLTVAGIVVICGLAVALLIHAMPVTPQPDVNTTIQVTGAIQ